MNGEAQCNMTGAEPNEERRTGIQPKYSLVSCCVMVFSVEKAL